MKGSSVARRILRIGFGCCALAALVVQSVAVLTVYGTDGTNYFANGSVLPVIAKILALFAGVFGSVDAIDMVLTPKVKDASSVRYPYPVFLLTAALGFLAAIPMSFIGGKGILSILTGIVLIPAFVYPLLKAIPAARAKIGNILVWLGFFSVIGCALLVAVYYFDHSVEMNAPMKTHLQLGLLLVMIYMTADLRETLSEAMPKLFRILSVWLISVGSLSAIPYGLAFLTGKTDRIDYFAGAVLIFGAWITAIGRLIALYLSDKQSQEHDI